MKDLAELSPYMGIYYLSLFMGLLVNGMPLLASLIFSLILVLIVLWGVVLHLHHHHASIETK